MRYIIKFDGEEIGAVTTNRSMTDEEICDFAGVELAITEEDFMNMPENGKHDLDELEIVEEADDFINRLNFLQAERREARESLYEEYGDHTDDAELAWSQRRQLWDDEINQIADDAEAAGCPVHWDSDAREWRKGAHIPDYAGVRWGDLTEEEQEELLMDASAVDGRTGDNLKGSGECIIDLTHPWSVAGRVEDGEIIIDDGAVIYNPITE